MDKILEIKLKNKGAKNYFKILSEIASIRGGKIKDGESYTNSKTSMIFIDAYDNEFSMKPSHILEGRWSPLTYNKNENPDYYFQKLNKIAKQRGGSIKKGEVYINSVTKITFIDQLNNEFKLTPGNLLSGKWSPLEKNRSEHICRQIVEQVYDKKFPSDYSTVKQKNGNRLQLDGYCKELNIAFEYQGEQHFIGWGSNKEKRKKSLAEIQKRDKEKSEQCKMKGILLLKINYYKDLNKPLDLISHTINFIKKSYIDLNMTIPLFLSKISIDKIKIDFTKISEVKKMYDELEAIVLKKGGRIKEGEVYINNVTKMTFIDEFNNEFSMSPSKIKSGRWSPYINGYIFDNPDYHFKELEKIALAKGGRIKEGERYVKNKEKMIFIDKLGNEFSACPNNIKNGRWSPFERKR